MALPLVAAVPGNDWTELFDGRTMNGWQPSEHKSSWKVVDGMLTADGPRSHLFYAGPVKGADFKNFELDVELTTKPECNSGIYFHSRYQETGFPEKGFEIQINNTAMGDGGYLERKKTGSLYGLRNMYKQLVPDEKPFRVLVAVRGKNVQIRLNGQLLVDYVQPTPAVIPTGGEKERFLDHGTFALQCHNQGSRVSYRSVRVRPLPDDLPDYTAAHPAPVVDDVFREVINIGRHNVPMVDYDVSLREGLTLDEVLAKSRKDGIQCGITVESSALNNDAEAERWMQPLAGRPVFSALLTTNGDWTRKLSRKTARQFDYIMGKGQTGNARSVSDPQGFMDGLLASTVARLNAEPLDIYSHATDLPPGLAERATELWTPARMGTLIEAFTRNKVAIELNSLQRLPSRQFIELARDAGCKFALGTGNQTAVQLRRCEYGLEMVESCKLDWKNFFAPGAWWPTAVERRWA